jgi:uncharacterized membrane protein YoaK (UPF0700 family)
MVALICFVLAVLASPFKMANSTSMRSPVARVTQAIGACIVPLPDDTWAAIVNTAREVGVSEVSIQRAVS